MEATIGEGGAKLSAELMCNDDGILEIIVVTEAGTVCFPLNEMIEEFYQSLSDRTDIEDPIDPEDIRAAAYEKAKPALRRAAERLCPKLIYPQQNEARLDQTVMFDVGDWYLSTEVTADILARSRKGLSEAIERGAARRVARFAEFRAVMAEQGVDAPTIDSVIARLAPDL
jgi:hypothetical protein